MAKPHTSELTTMRYFFTIGVLLAVAASKSSPDVQIENKNINVIVNADSKQIARELWKIIERHLKRNPDSFTRRSDSQESETVEELEEVIKSVVRPSRRSGPPTDEELAKNFEIIVRRALPPTETYGSDPINDIVDDMLTATRKSLNRTSAIIKSKKEETAGEKPSLIGGSDGYSRASLLTAHQIMRSLKNIKKSVKNCVFMKTGVPDDFPVTFDPEYPNDLDWSKNTVRRSSEAAGQPPHSYDIVEGKPRQDNRKQRNSNASVRSRQKGNYNKLHRQEEFVDDAEKDQEQEAVEEQSRYLAKRVIQSLRKKYRGRFTKRDLSVISSTVKRVLSKKSSCRGPTKKKYNKKKWKRQNTENDYDVESGDYEEEETAPSAEAVDAETRNSTSDGSMNINTNVNRIRPNRRSFTSNSNSNLVKSGRHGKKKLKRQNEIDGSTGESLEVPADVNVTASLEFDPTDPLVPRKSPRVKLLRKTRRGYNMNSNRNSYGSSKHKKKRYRPRQDDYIIEDNEDYSDSSSNDIGSDSESSSSEYGNVNSSDNWMNRDDDYDDEYDDEDEEYDDSDEYEDSDERLKRRRRRNRRDGEEISTTTAATPPERRGSSSSKLKSRKNKG